MVYLSPSPQLDVHDVSRINTLPYYSFHCYDLGYVQVLRYERDDEFRFNGSRVTIAMLSIVNFSY